MQEEGDDMYQFIYALVMIIVAVLLIWLGRYRRKKACENFEQDSQKYRGVTTMTVIRVDKVEDEVWEDREDGNKVQMPVTYYCPTYEYTVDGKTYQYFSRQSTQGTRQVGSQIPGYYDPANPQDITENRIRKPALAGGIFFVLAAVLIVFAVIMVWSGM